jgi:hypothetical protein
MDAAAFGTSMALVSFVALRSPIVSSDVGLRSTLSEVAAGSGLSIDLFGKFDSVI